MSYTYPTPLYANATDVATVATELAQRQSDTGTTNGGINAGGGAAVPQIGVDAAGLGLSYLKAQADVLLASANLHLQSDQAGSTTNSTGTTHSNVFPSWSPSIPIAKTYTLHVDLTCFMSVASDTVFFEVLVDGATTGAGNLTNSSSLNFTTLSLRQKVTWRQFVAFGTAGSHTLQLRWWTTGVGTAGINSFDSCLLTVTG